MHLLFSLLVLIPLPFAESAYLRKFNNYCAVRFNNGTKYYATDRFINLTQPEDVDLTKPFVRLLREKGAPGAIKKTTLEMPFAFSDILVVRSDINVLNEDIQIDTILPRTDLTNALGYAQRQADRLLTRIHPATSKDTIIQRIKNILEYLYVTQFSNQGPERNSHLDIYRSEDESFALRTTHFIHSINEEEIAHIQAQSSVDPDTEPLNVDSQFKIPRKKGELYFNVGRFNLVRDENISPGTRAIMSVQGITKKVMMYRTLQKLTSWLARDVRAAHVIFQVNTPVLRFLKRAFAPLKFPETHLIKGDPQEWVINADIEFVKQVEGLSTAFILHHFLERDLAKKPEKANAPWTWAFWPNEFQVLAEIGVMDAAVATQVRAYLELGQEGPRNERQKAKFRLHVANESMRLHVISLDRQAMGELKDKLAARFKLEEPHDTNSPELSATAYH